MHQAKKTKRGKVKATGPPAPPKLEVNDDGEVVEVSSDNWKENLTSKDIDPYCKGCKSVETCTIARIAVVVCCDRRS